MDIVIIGAGGHGRVVLDIVQRAGVHSVKGYLDSNPEIGGRRIDGIPVLGGPEMVNELRDNGLAGAIVAIGDNGARRQWADLIDHASLELVNAIHPSANLAKTVTLGRNVVIAAGALVCAHCQIGDLAILNTGCIVDHESMIGTAVHICPGVRIAGRVTVESGAFVGIGATIIQNIRIGYEAVIGAGAVVISNVHPMTTCVGMPAKEIKHSPEQEPATPLPTLKETVTSA